MTYEEAISKTFTRSEAKAEIERQIGTYCTFSLKGQIVRTAPSWQEFQKDVGSKVAYTGAEVLGWLGY